MVQIHMITNYYRDCCKTPMSKRIAYKNDGSYHDDFIEIVVMYPETVNDHIDSCLYGSSWGMDQKDYTAIEQCFKDNNIDKYTYNGRGGFNITEYTKQGLK